MAYSLTRHLMDLCENDPEYSCLYASWITEKEIISKALSTINFNFPHYSLHDESHSISIIKNIEMLLGEDRIKLLGATETWVILMASYLHDVGMVIFNDLLDEKWKQSEFQEYLFRLASSSNDKDLQECANYILNIQRMIFNNDNNSKGKTIEYLLEKNWPVKVRNCVIKISSEYFRRNHSKRSNEYIKNSKTNMFNINNSGIILDRLVNVIADIALCHELSFQECLKLLKYKSNGIGTDKFHPRFIACLIRLGDLLDLDNGRFNTFYGKVIGRLPKISDNHRLKHSSITHLLIEPKTIEIEANCANEDVYRITREWINWLIEEVRNLSSNWSKIVPDNFTGGPPTIENVRLFLDGKENVSEQVDLKFFIPQEKAFELFEGFNIYDNELVFIREFIQNAMDSSKIQMWKDICRGNYDSLLKLNNITLNNIKYINDIPQEIWDNYPITIKISTDEQNEEYIYISVMDNGCGFSRNNLVRLVNLGESWGLDKDFIEIIDSMPTWLKPTGAFGIGMQSAFMVTDEINIYTKTDTEEDKKISLVSGKDSGYVVVKDINESSKRRTNVIVIIKKDLCNKVIQKQHIQYNYDYFAFNNKNSRVLSSILDMIKKMIIGDCFRIYVDIPEILDKPYIIVGNYHRKVEVKNYNEWIQYKIEVEDDDGIICHLWENKLGSYIKLVPNFEVLNNSELGPYQRIKIFFRGIFLKETSYNTYFKVSWDLLGIDTKDYLDIGRNNIKKSEEDKLISFLNENIIPVALEVINNELRFRMQKNTDSKVINEKDLFTLYLAYLVYCGGNDQKDIYPLTEFEVSIEIPENACKSKFNQTIKLSEFFKINSFLVYEREFLSLNEELQILDKYKDENFEAYLTKPLFFEEYLRKYFYIEKIFLSSSSNDTINLLKNDGLSGSIFIYLMRRKNDLSYRAIDVSDFDKKRIILSLKDKDGFFMYTRKLIYPIEPYAKYLAVNKAPESTFINRLYYTDNFIISPFYKQNNNYTDYDLENSLFKSDNIKDSFDDNFKEQIRRLLLYDGLIDWVIDYSANRKKILSREEVIEAYLTLIKEYYYTKFTFNKEPGDE